MREEEVEKEGARGKKKKKKVQKKKVRNRGRDSTVHQALDVNRMPGWVSTGAS